MSLADEPTAAHTPSMLSTLPDWITSPWVASPLGFLFLWLGAEGLVRGASRIAASLGISQVVIGLTLVAFGTSLPELLVCVTAAHRGAPDFAVGNVVGSNIANIGLIAGFAAVLAPLAVGRIFLTRDLPWAFIAAVLLTVFAIGGLVGRIEGLFLLLLFCVYMARLIRTELKSGTGALVDEEVEAPETPTALMTDLALAVVGLGMLLIGAPLLIEGATATARAFGISELVIGLTMVAVGTSLPELATAVVAAKHGKDEIILGNVVGSNIFNVMLVLALTCAVKPVAVSTNALWLDMPIMIGFTILLAVLCFTGRRLTRAEGLSLLVLYLGYTIWLFMRGEAAV